MNFREAGKTLILVSGWVATLFVGVLDLPQKIHSFSETLPAAKEDVVTWWNLNTEFTGSWTNDGDITSTSGAMPVALKIRVYGGKVDGEIWSNGLSDTIHPTILLGGDLRHGKLDAYAFDYIGGREVVYAIFNIEKKGDNLVLVTREQQVQFFPKEAMLFANPDALKEKPLTNFDLILKMLKSQKK
ncbi:hypothetical protein [Bradyrhizobium ganzhouense]|uniref:hypothetical protein n=1 Tax=Bradyrhizobium ganzhouense TaxID=1179767 RepID=UPI003CECD0DB